MVFCQSCRFSLKRQGRALRSTCPPLSTFWPSGAGRSSVRVSTLQHHVFKTGLTEKNQTSSPLIYIEQAADPVEPVKPHSSVEHTLQRCNNRAKSMIRKLLTANRNGFTGISVSTTHTHTHKKQSEKWLKVGFRLWVQRSNLVRLRLSSFDKVSMKFVLFYSPFLNWPSEESHQRHTHTLNSVGTEHNKTGSVLQCSFRKGPFQSKTILNSPREIGELQADVKVVQWQWSHMWKCRFFKFRGERAIMRMMSL